MTLPIAVVDAFTSEPFRGNPAAVCLLERPAPEAWMRRVAAEMNLSETAFLVPPGADAAYDLRWFTPKVEVALCGHATLASAHFLWESGRLPRGTPASFSTKSGVLVARERGDRIELDFPARRAAAAEPPDGLLDALGCTAQWVGRSAYDYLVLADSETTVRALAPDHARLRGLDVRGVIVTAPGRDYDFVSRFFAPGSGIDEDPVTGSAHCTLGPFWSERLGKSDMVAFQASARGGVVGVGVAGERVKLRGQAITIWTGALIPDPGA